MRKTILIVDLACGESFSIETPLSIPIADVTIKMTIKTSYKLLSITKGIADFDVSSVYIMKTTITKHPIKATGSGKGKLLYDVSNNYNLKYQTDTKMEMNIKLDNFNLDIKSTSGFTQTSKIIKNTSRQQHLCLMRAEVKAFAKAVPSGKKLFCFANVY